MKWRIGPLIAIVLLVGACTSAPAPVVDRSHSPSRSMLEADGRYRVRKGDSLYAIAFRFGLDHRDLATWNNIHPPYTIYPDQLLRMKRYSAAESQPVVKVLPPASVPKTSAPKGDSSVPSTKPVSPKPDTAKPAPAKSATGGTPTATTQSPAVAKSGELSWQWPATGRVVRNYLANDPSRNGLDISGTVGQAVQSAAPGTVVYSGSGLIGYGELIIIKHNDEFLSAYAHNRQRLVEEGAVVSAGQKIAEMGKNDRNETVLHFEIRVNGRPVDPRKYLPQP